MTVAAHTTVIDAGTALYRVHRTRPGSVAYFDTSVEYGRFNLVDVVERGTCYVALDPLGAYVETLGRILTRPQSDIDDRRLSVVTTARDLQLFDLTQSNARTAYQDDDLDLTATIGAGDNYETPQRLARLVHEDHYDGLLYTARHDPGHAHRSVALFGPAGPNNFDAAFDTCKTDTIADGLVDLARDTFGITVLPYTTL